MINLLQPQTPELGSFARGLASKRPNLWDGLIGLWKPSLGVTGLILRDISGFGNDGTLTDMTIDDWVIGGNPRNPGYALDFDGVDDYVDPNTVFSSVPLTLIAWVNLDVTGVNGDIISLSNDSITDNFIRLTYNSSATAFTIRARDDATAAAITTSITTPAVSTWFHVTAVLSAIDNRKIYINGILEDTNTTSKTPTLNNTTFGAVFLTGGPPTQFLNGKIGGIHIYTRALSPSEILDMYLFPNAMFEYEDRFIPRAPVTGVDVRKHIIQAYMRMCA